jgi:hypothetical protein
MPMLHRCSFAHCDTLTLSPYCFEHELLIRAELEAEREQAAVRDEPLAREAAVAAPIHAWRAPPELPST